MSDREIIARAKYVIFVVVLGIAPFGFLALLGSIVGAFMGHRIVE